MSKSLHDQVANRCRHFNGVQNKCCDAGIAYADVRDENGPPLKNIPCFKDINLHCDKKEFLSEEEVQKEVELLTSAGDNALMLLIAAKEAYGKTKEWKAHFKCPHGDHYALYMRADTNGHFWVNCSTCDLRFNE